MIELSIIIVSYNTKNILLDCIKSILNTVENISYEIIVVDNASTDGTAGKIQNSRFARESRRAKFKIPASPANRGEQNSKFKIIKNEKNEGFSKANNIGVKQANGKYILFLNSDTVVHLGSIETMVRFMNDHQDVAAATCRVELPSGKIDEACHRGFPTPWNSFSHFSGLSRLFPKSKIFANYSLGWMNILNDHPIDACCGAFMIVRREAGEQISWWDEDYFWYGEDLDFCYRLKEKGWKVYFVANCSILHYKGVSGGIKNVSKHLTAADKQTKKLAKKARFEAMRIFYKKHYQKTYPKIITNLVLNGISLKERLTL